jgi:integrase
VKASLVAAEVPPPADAGDASDAGRDGVEPPGWPADAPGHGRQVRGLHRAVAAAVLDALGSRVCASTIRHTRLASDRPRRVDVVYVSRQLGHAHVTTTLDTYTHLFDHVRNAETVK